MKILALDPAEKFGWAISRNLYGTWSFKLSRDESFAMKLIRMKAKLKEIIETEKIDIVVFERPSGRMPAAIMSHAKFVAIVEIYCTENNIPYKGYSANEIKKFASGKGNCNKQVMLEEAKRQLGYPGKDDNEADALWLLELAKSDVLK